MKPLAIDPIVALDAEALSQAIHARQLSCREVMQAYLGHVERFNRQVNALVSLRPAEVLLAEAEVKSAADAPRLTFGGAMKLLWQSLLGA